MTEKSQTYMNELNKKFERSVQSKAKLSSPVVQDNSHSANTIPWWLRAITCITCQQTYKMVKDELDPHFLSKVTKGFL